MQTATEKKTAKQQAKAQMGDQSNPVVIKKYNNRKLYDTQRSCYITLGELQAMLEKDVHVKVITNTSAEDITGQTMIDVLMLKAKKSIDLGSQEAQDKIRELIKTESIVA